MPLQSGAAMVGSNLDRQVQNKISRVFAKLDKKVAEIARAKNLFPTQIKLLQPLHFCVIVGDERVYVVLSTHNVGGMANHQFMDLSGKEMNLQIAVFLTERDLSFQNAFGFQFPRNMLDLPDDEQDQEIEKMAEQYINDEIINLERLNRIVRINPIFQGRDFLINERSIFVLSPFSEPFNTIYNDHIKPTVEEMDNFTCLRADDIYDNRPIIEDIWRSINESKIIISELTGKNPNVFYETGIAHTIGKEVILITQLMDDIPFDLRHLRCIVYEYTPRGVQNLEVNLKNTILSILNRQN